MTLKQLAEELNDHNQDKDIGLYRASGYGYQGTEWIDCMKKHGGGYLISKEDAEELLRSYKEGQ